MCVLYLYFPQELSLKTLRDSGLLRMDRHHGGGEKQQQKHVDLARSALRAQAFRNRSLGEGHGSSKARAFVHLFSQKERRCLSVRGEGGVAAASALGVVLLEFMRGQFVSQPPDGQTPVVCNQKLYLAFISKGV